MAMTDQQIRAIAFLTTQIRTTWDTPGVIAALEKIRHLNLADVTLAATRAADDPDIRTPGAIANTNATCWQERNPDRPPPRQPFDPTNTCGTCSLTRDRCRATWAKDHDFTPTREQRRLPADQAAGIIAELRDRAHPDHEEQP